MILLIDNYDSFTYNLKDYFARLGESLLLIKNDEADAASIRSYSFDRLVISPGPNTPAQSGNLMPIISTLYNEVPILGICLGHQALGQFFGAELQRAKRPVHGKVSPVFHSGTGLYNGLPQGFRVCRYHSLILEHFQDTPLEVCASTAEGECMGFVHRELPVYGMQYHPEAILTEYGLRQLELWLELTNRAGS